MIFLHFHQNHVFFQFSMKKLSISNVFHTSHKCLVTASRVSPAQRFATTAANGASGDQVCARSRPMCRRAAALRRSCTGCVPCTAFGVGSKTIDRGRARGSLARHGPTKWFVSCPARSNDRAYVGRADGLRGTARTVRST